MMMMMTVKYATSNIMTVQTSIKIKNAELAMAMHNAVKIKF